MICSSKTFRIVPIVFGGMKKYREEKGSSFTHNKKKYDLNCVLEKVDDAPINNMSVSDLDWMIKEASLEMTDDDKKRIEKADLSTPILIADHKGRPAVIDGMHRLTKAHMNGVKCLPTKFVSDQILDSCEKRN